MRPGRREHPAILAVLAASGTILAACGTVEAQEGWRLGPGLQLSHSGADFKLTLRGYAQGDLRSRRNFTDGDEEDEGLNGTTTSLRRARVGLEGEWRRLNFEVTVDPADDGEHLKDLYGEYRFAKAFRVRAGHVKVPFSQEWLTSAAKTDFVERSMLVSNLAESRDWGVMAFGAAAKGLDYLVGIYKGDGRTQRSRADRTVGARLEYAASKALDLGASFTDGNVAAPAEQEGVESIPRGLPGEGASGFRFSDPRFVHGNRRRFGADARWSKGPMALRGEWLRIREAREGQGPVFDDLPAEIGQGWVASATWLVTGEKKSRTITPGRPLSKGGPGAIEVGARYETLRFDDEDGDTGFAGAGNRARNIRPAADRAVTGGLSWWPESWVRVMGNVVLERFEDALLAPEPGRQGRYVTILGRLQFQLP